MLCYRHLTAEVANDIVNTASQMLVAKSLCEDRAEARVRFRHLVKRLLVDVVFCINEAGEGGLPLVCNDGVSEVEACLRRFTRKGAERLRVVNALVSSVAPHEISFTKRVPRREPTRLPVLLKKAPMIDEKK